MASESTKKTQIVEKHCSSGYNNQVTSNIGYSGRTIKYIFDLGYDYSVTQSYQSVFFVHFN